MKKAFSAAVIASSLTAVSGVANAYECRVEDTLYNLKSYHQANRSYETEAANPNYSLTGYDQSPTVKNFTHYNETNPGVIFGLECNEMPKYMQHVKLGVIAMNSYGRTSTVLAFENTLAENDYAKLNTIVGVFPTGYKSIMPFAGLSLEGKGPFEIKTQDMRIRPYLMVAPAGLVTEGDPRKNIWTFGIRTVFNGPGPGSIDLSFKPKKPEFNL